SFLRHDEAELLGVEPELHRRHRDRLPISIDLERRFALELERPPATHLDEGLANVSSVVRNRQRHQKLRLRRPVDDAGIELPVVDLRAGYDPDSSTVLA